MSRSLLMAALIFGAAGSIEPACGQTSLPASAGPGLTPSADTSSSPSLIQSPAPLPTASLASYEQRRANAETVNVMDSILDLEPGSSLKQAHAKLDELSDPAHPPKQEEEGPRKGEASEHKVLWQLAKTDYSFVFVKADDQERISYIKAFLRPGKEPPFDKIGDAKKAPVQDANTIAWDVLRPDRPLFRVVATGAERKATSIMIFVVKRPQLEKTGSD
ncbi:MAG: hypothetical protein DME86_11550 [Verrucomicrobia bacterium]|nr:MAG: hypothetical protein DME86_11550 [Verrucomicrobiota bacterium]